MLLIECLDEVSIDIIDCIPRVISTEGGIIVRPELAYLVLDRFVRPCLIRNTLPISIFIFVREAEVRIGIKRPDILYEVKLAANGDGGFIHLVVRTSSLLEHSQTASTYAGPCSVRITRNIQRRLTINLMEEAHTRIEDCRRTIVTVRICYI